jgi:DNA-directed RNA polymerase specialized sigma24 family protein
MNHDEANETVIEYRKVVYAAVNRAGLKFGSIQAADLDDLAGDVFVILVARALPQYNGAITIRSFVYMVADRYARKALSRRRTFEHYDTTENASFDEEAGEYSGHVAACDASGLDAGVAAAIECARLQTAMEELSEAEQNLVTAIVEDSCPDYATAYGLTPVQMTRAKAKVRAKLA